MRNRERSLTPILQIVHVTDLHLLHREYEHSNDVVVMRRLLRRIERLGPVIARAFNQREDFIREKAEAIWAVSESGRYGHEEKAIELLEEWLFERVLGDDDWHGTPIWLVDTGDQTTNGNSLSFDYSYEVLERLSKSLSDAPCIRIHGNHDAWPGRPPHTFFNGNRLHNHREWLRRHHYTDSYPNLLYPMLESGDIGVDVFTLNSIVHDWLRSCLARGEIAEDRY